MKKNGERDRVREKGRTNGKNENPSTVINCTVSRDVTSN